MGVRTVGVEEEFLLVDAETGQAKARSSAVLRYSADADAEGSAELQREQVEVETRPCSSLAELAEEIARQRRSVVDAARRAGAEVAALGASPLPVHPSLTHDARYEQMGRRFGLTAREALTCACHVHVEVDSDDEAIAVLNRIRPWLPPLLAVSANSPFWQGEDTGYQSYRSQVWSRWPSAGPTGDFESAADYHAVVEELLATGVLLDEKMLYFDVRPSAAYPTVEVRVADVCLHGDDTVLVAALTRALVETAARDWAAGRPHRPHRVELARLAMWRAARSGTSGELVDPATGTAAPAAVVLDRLLEHTRDALTEAGELDLVTARLAAVRDGDGGAAEQRRIHTRTGRLEDVVGAATEAITAELDSWA